MRPYVKISAIVLCVIVFGSVTFTLLMLNFAGVESQIRHQITYITAARDEQFLREAGVLLGPPLVGGNTIKDLQNGDEIFPAMLDAIRSAAISINLESYIFASDEIGTAFIEALIERARAGVPVQLLLDAVGSEQLDDESLRAMEEAGVRFKQYHPISPFHISRWNNRTHRKILVVDGRIGFTGGVGIADPWLGDGLHANQWRDMHFRVEGPVVAQMQSVFNDNWIKVTGEVLSGPTYYPKIESVGTTTAQVFASSPTGGAESMHLMYLLSIAAAQETIDIVASYFVPDQLTASALEGALARGIRIRLLLPSEKTDSTIVWLASRGFWHRLLQNGAEIHVYNPAMLHTKMMIVDRQIVSVGSTNFDSRSFTLNDEANLNVYDQAFAEHLTRVFERDLTHSHAIDPAEWQLRPWRQKLLERVVALLNSQL